MRHVTINYVAKQILTVLRLKAEFVGIKKKSKFYFKMSKEDKIMAKNWKMGEAVRAIQEGNKEDIQDIGRRFPLFANLAAQVNDAGAALIDCVPDYCTARKIESVLKGDVQPNAEVEGEEAEEEEQAKKPAKKAPAKYPDIVSSFLTIFLLIFPSKKEISKSSIISCASSLVVMIYVLFLLRLVLVKKDNSTGI